MIVVGVAKVDDVDGDDRFSISSITPAAHKEKSMPNTYVLYNLAFDAQTPGIICFIRIKTLSILMTTSSTGPLVLMSQHRLSVVVASTRFVPDRKLLSMYMDARYDCTASHRSAR